MLTVEASIMDLSKIQGRRLSLIDDKVAENLYFRGCQVTATIGVKDGPLCGPILNLVSTRESSLEMRAEGVSISWENIRVKNDKVHVLRNDAEAVYYFSD